MGLIIFVIIMSSLIVSQVRSIIVMKTVDDDSEEYGDDYFDDFETLWFLIFFLAWAWPQGDVLIPF